MNTMKFMGAALLLLLGLATAGGAKAQGTADDERARTHFQSGRSYYEEGAYDRALEEFTRAFDLSHRPALLFNLATVNERLARYREAAQNLRDYLEAMPDVDERATLERRIGNLERLQTQFDERNARALQAATTAQTATAVPSTSEPGTAEPSELPPAQASGGSDGLFWGAIGGFGVAAAGGGLMAAFGAMALSENDALASGCGASAACSPADISSADTFALLSDVGLGLAVAGAAAGTVLLVLSMGDEGGGESASLVPLVTPNSAGALVRGRF